MSIRKHILLCSVALLSSVTFFSAWNTGNIYILFFACIVSAFLLVGWLYPSWAIRPLSLSIDDLPTDINDKSPLTLKINAKNSGWLARREIFFGVNTNANHNGLTISLQNILPPIKHGSSILDIHLKSIKRGRYNLYNAASFYSGFPFGFATKSQKIYTPKNELVVYPHRFPINGDILNAGNKVDYLPINTRQTPGSTSEFFAVREYRYGDSVRHIDWKNSAKHNEMVVREFEQTTQKSCLIVINDSNSFLSDADKNDIFEKSIRVAASIATSLIRGGNPVGIFCKNSFTNSDIGFEHENNIMNFLVDVQCNKNSSYWDNAYNHISQSMAGHTIFIFENDLIESYENIQKRVDLLTLIGCDVKLMLFTNKNDAPHIPNATILKISPKNEERGLLPE